MSSEPEHNDFSHLKTLHKYKKAKQALQDIARKQPGYEHTAEYLALLQGLQQEARQYCEKVATSIEDILNKSVLELDDAADTQVKALFEDYEAADLSEDGALTSYRARWARQLAERDHFRQYKRVKDEVETLWRTARAKARQIENVSTDDLLKDYKDALTLVRQAISDSPGNNYLKPLLDKAQAERERIAKERDAMTSGAQSEQFLAVFRYVDEAGDQDYIQLYDLNGKPTERKIKAEALEETKKQAIQVANEKVVKYCEDAQAALRRHDPRSAQAELDKVAKFDELKEFIPETELYKPAVFGLLKDTRTKTEALLNNLEAAEGKVKEAVQRLERERDYTRPAIEAIWQAYSQAIARLQSVDMIERSEDLRRAREYLRETLGVLLDKQLDDAEALLKAWQLDDLEDKLVEIDRMYTPIDLLHHEPSWNRWQDLRQKFDQLEARRESISQTLQQLNQQMSSPQQANLSLQALEAQHDLKLLALDPLYETVKASVNLAVNRQGELERLSSFLRSTNSAQVEGALQSAQNAAAQDDDFMTLAGQLEAHLCYLKACQLLDEGNYELGISELEALSKRSDLSEQQQKAIEERLKQAQQIAQTSTINDKLIDEAENSTTLETAWDRLRSVKVFTSQQQRERWKSVLTRTLETLRDDLERPFSLQHFNELMSLVSQDVAFVDAWRRSLERQRTMQNVRDFMEKGDFTNARALLENLLNQVSGPDLTRVRTLMARVEKELLGKDKDALLWRHQALDAQREDDLAVYQADLERMSTRLQDQVETAKNAENWQDYVELAAWRVEVDLMRAAKTYESARRQSIFHAIADYAGDLGTRCRQVTREVANLPGVFSGYERLGSIASQSKDIQRAIKLCEDHISLEAQIDRFQEALKAWQTYVQPYADQTALALFKADFDERVTRLITSLRQTAQEQDDLPSYAKLKLLGDTLGDRLIDKLRNASGQINQEFRVIIDTLYNAGSYGHLDRHLRLAAQIQGIEAQIRRLSTLSSTAHMFDQIQAGENGEQLAKRCEQQVKLLEQSSNLLSEIGRKVDTFFDYLRNYCLTWLALRSYAREMDGRARNLRDEVGSACAKLAEKFDGLSIPAPERLDQLIQDHPHMQEAEARLSRRKQELSQLASPLIQLDDAFRQEKFREARQLLESVDEQKLRGHDIYDDFEAVYCDKAVVGWEKTRDLVDKAWRDWQPLEEWQQKAPSYEAWQRDMDEVEQHRRMARFDRAKKLLSWMIDQIRRAEQHRRNAPVAQPCSQRGQQLMATMEQERQGYQDRLREAQDRLRAIEADERRWEELKARMQGVATRLAQSLKAFCKHRGALGQWAFSDNLYKELQAALASYDETLEDMGKLCPEDHEGHQGVFSQYGVYQRARAAVRDRRCDG